MKKLILCLLCCALLVACAEKTEPKDMLTQAYDNLSGTYKHDDAVAVIFYDDEIVHMPVTDHLGSFVDPVLVLAKESGSCVRFFRIYADGMDDYNMESEPAYEVQAQKDTVIRFNAADQGYNSMWFLQIITPDGKVYGSPIPYPCETEETAICVGKAWDEKERFAYGWGEEIAATEKPVIYLYPEEECRVDVRLDYAGELTCTYPSYNDGWSVTARPDGTLIDDTGMQYQYLYWEGEGYKNFDFSEGFCVAGEDTAAFLEVALEKLGLNRREANEFIIYWLPRMQNNPYNVIAFQTETYEEAAKLHISPEPDTLLRVFMAWYGTKTPVDLPAQELTAPVREGFTVVEWGGAEMAHP